MKYFFLAVLTILNSGCAILHKVQVSDIDNRENFVQVPFEIKLSEVGVDVQRVGKTIDDLSRNDSKKAKSIADTVAAFQVGPRTGIPVYSTKWTENLIYKIYESCPSGRVSNLVSIRENRDYGGISGELVRVNGVCLKPKM